MTDHIALFVVGFWVGCGLMMLAFFVWDEVVWWRDEQRCARMLRLGEEADLDEAVAEYVEWVRGLPCDERRMA